MQLYDSILPPEIFSQINSTMTPIWKATTKGMSAGFVIFAISFGENLTVKHLFISHYVVVKTKINYILH